jgi:hypothetical protein
MATPTVGRLRKRDNLLTGGGGGEGGDVLGAKSFDLKNTWSSIYHLILSGWLLTHLNKTR